MQFHAMRKTRSWLFSTQWPLLAAVLVCASATLAALKAVADATAALVNDDAQGFLDQFDRNMPAYPTLRTEVEGLLNANSVGSTVDVITNDGDDRKRTLELDWVLVLSEKSSTSRGSETRRGIVKCQIEHTGKTWKITALEPVEFFRQ